jgi:hypothetical protein
MRTGNKVMISMRVSREVWHSRVYMKVVSVFDRFIRGWVKWAKFGIKECW